MAISYPVTLPATPKPARVTLTQSSIVAITRSPFTGQAEVQEHPGQLWQAEIAWDTLRRLEAEPLIAAIMQLKGQFGTFLLGDPLGAQPRGNPQGAPVVDGAGQTGNSLLTRGWTASAQGVLLAGDYIRLGSGATTRLHKVLIDASADGFGKATLDIWPRLREAPADAQSVITSNAQGVFRLASNDVVWPIRAPNIYSLSIAAIEAI